MSETPVVAVTPPDRSYMIEIVAAILLGLATVGAAFAAFQASKYDGNSLDGYSEAISKVTESSAKQLEASQAYTFDMITWMEWQSRMISADKADGAQSKIDGEIADSIKDDFMEERMINALIWSEEESVKTKKFVHPTDSPDYGTDLFADTFEVQADSQKAMEAAKKANDLGDQFTLVTVLFTIVLFFTGIATVFKKEPVKFTLLIISVVVFVLTAAKMFTLPMAS